METILIADAGSTKTEWLILDKGGMVCGRYLGPGINAAILPDQELISRFEDATSYLCDNTEDCSVESIVYYGAGCASDAINSRVSAALRESWPTAGSVDVYSDLTGAAHAMLGHRKGVVCILGTGSNTALYDGHTIIDNIPSLGYILGDEGSGAALGRRLISDVFKRVASDSLVNEFNNEYNLSYQDIIERVYRTLEPNRFLASMTVFLRKHISMPEVHSMIVDEFEKFIVRNLLAYPDVRDLPVCFAGGVAQTFSRQLEEALRRHGIQCEAVFPNPMPGLIVYHSDSETTPNAIKPDFI